MSRQLYLFNHPSDLLAVPPVVKEKPINLKSRQAVFIRFNTIFIFMPSPTLSLRIYSLDKIDKFFDEYGDIPDRRWGNWTLKDKRIIKLWDWLIKKGYPESGRGDCDQDYRWYVKINTVYRQKT